MIAKLKREVSISHSTLSHYPSLPRLSLLVLEHRGIAPLGGRKTRRQILLSRSPGTLIRTQRQIQNPTVQEEVMINPIFRINHPIERCALDINIPIRSVEIDIADRSRLPRHTVCDGNRGEKGRGDEVHVLTWVRENAEHSERDERSHGAAVVVAGNSGGGGIEIARDVEMCSFGALGWAAGVVVLVNCQECLFVADVEKSGFMQVVESPDKLFGAPECDDQGCHVPRNEKAI